jgi:hypothetical protein
MGRYKKATPRLSVKFLDGNDTSKVLFEVNDRDHMNVGEMFSDTYVSALISQSISEQNLPDNVLVLVTGEFQKIG